MDIYKSSNWKVVFVDWCQEFPGQCIISSNKKCLVKIKMDKWNKMGGLKYDYYIFNKTFKNTKSK